MSVAWGQPTVGGVAPDRRRDTLAWVAWGLIASWSLMSVLVALYGALNMTLGDRGSTNIKQLSTHSGIAFLLFGLWALSSYAAFAGLVMAIVSLVRGPDGVDGRVWRSVALVTLISAGAVVAVWGIIGGTLNYGAQSVDTDRVHALATCLAAVAVVAGTAGLVGLARTER